MSDASCWSCSSYKEVTISFLRKLDRRAVSKLITPYTPPPSKLLAVTKPKP